MRDEPVEAVGDPAVDRGQGRPFGADEHEEHGEHERGRGYPDQRGQASAEYALVLLGAAAIALLVVAWATKNDMVGKLMDGVMKHILDSIK